VPPEGGRWSTVLGYPMRSAYKAGAGAGAMAGGRGGIGPTPAFIQASHLASMIQLHVSGSSRIRERVCTWPGHPQSPLPGRLFKPLVLVSSFLLLVPSRPSRSLAFLPRGVTTAQASCAVERK